MRRSDLFAIGFASALAIAPLRAAPQELPPPTPVNGVTLDQVINASLLADPVLRAAFEGVRQAQADTLTASLPPNPDLFLDGQLLPLTRPFTQAKTGGPPQQDVTLTYGIDWLVFGKRAAAVAAATLGIRVAEADYADRVRQRVTEATVTYYDVLEAKALLAIAQQDAASLERVEAVTRKGVDSGGRAQVELNRVRLDRLTAERAVRDAEATLTTARANLRARMGRSDSDPAFDVAGDLLAPPTQPLPPVDAAYAIALQGRPDLQSLRWKIAQADANVTLEKRRACPAVAPVLGFTRQYQGRAVGAPDASSYLVGGTINLPVFNRNQGNRAKASSNAVQSRFEEQAGENDLRAEVAGALASLDVAQRNATALSGEQLTLAGEVRDSISQAYAAGGRSLLETLDAQRNYRDTYRAATSSRANYWRSAARFHSALGEQYHPHDPTPAVPAAP